MSRTSGLRYFACLLLTLALNAPALAAAPELTPRENRGRLEIVGADRQLRYWVDRFGRVHSPEMTLAADAYNDWISNRFRGLFGVEPPSGSIEFVSHMPPGPRGIDPQTGVFRVPHRIHSDGALTRDLLSAPFFQLKIITGSGLTLRQTV